jgi:hypothetical protein
VVKKFADYCLLHQNKDVIYFYDNTAKARDADKDEKKPLLYAINELIDEGYNVTLLIYLKLHRRIDMIYGVMCSMRW